MKLTPSRRKALEWFRDNDGSKFFPVAVSRSVVRTLVEGGLLREQKPEFGFVRTFITEAGRAALSEEKGS
jgi:hypothetical protein